MSAPFDRDKAMAYLLDRFDPQPNGCWNWTGVRVKNGYGQAWVGGEQPRRRAHRIAYELLVGEIDDGLTIDHLCRNTSCVNPDHMEQVSLAENSRRMIAGAPHRFAEQTHCRKGHELSPDNVRWNRWGDKATRSCRTCRNDYNREYLRAWWANKRQGRAS